MKEVYLAVLLGVSLILCLNLIEACAEIRVRKEIRDLSPDELSRLHAAIKTLNTRTAGQMRSTWDLDWSIDSQAPEQSIVFSDAYFGGNGDPSNGGCLSTGPYANWNVSIPQTHCLARSFNGGTKISSFVAPVILALIISQSNDFDAFRQAIESTPHAAPHINIGGDMRTMYSPNDPLFYLHHAYVDKVWYSFQLKNNKSFFYAFDSETNPNINRNYILAPFNTPVSSVLDPLQLCYRYQEPSARSGPASRPFAATTSFGPDLNSQNGSVASDVNAPSSRTVITSERNEVSKFNFSATFLLGSNGTLISSAVFSANKSAVALAYSILDAIVGSPQSALQVRDANFFEKMFSFDKALIEGRNPDSLDRQDVTKLRLPQEIDDEYIHHMGMDFNAVRNIESALSTLYDLSNNS
ncbi:hypothetical protein DI09_18p150 [Mitosporidium daphniae]|uniref:Tyrosinase copper-binding domain-containing protein n=1 Tax=Mitosporidium daphniae TaxID=1485682 RepID=A0A098VU05_9MICR|nr:uncharacterized protein DI09_18p150 [Mitosporidium daphniae]KGG52309.1 hypothetical protein DI09_18p150 [Mitosporidium daphniae]|eukprot:XP_013238736.1 uncharacterized protein DI09_18p150 [Mitosporidium daphniae]